MKKFLMFCLLGTAVVALSACAKERGDADYGYEREAPYAAERTVGDKPAEEVFHRRQVK